MNILYQTNPKGSGGDCLRTVFAMLLNKQQSEVEDIPDFGADDCRNFEKTLKDYLSSQQLHYQEIPFDSMPRRHTSNHVTEGVCVIVANYQGIPHAMGGYLRHEVLDGNISKYFLEILNCPIRGEMRINHNDYDEEILGVGFLTRKL